MLLRCHPTSPNVQRTHSAFVCSICVKYQSHFLQWLIAFWRVILMNCSSQAKVKLWLNTWINVYKKRNRLSCTVKSIEHLIIILVSEWLSIVLRCCISFLIFYLFVSFFCCFFLFVSDWIIFICKMSFSSKFRIWLK